MENKNIKKEGIYARNCVGVGIEFQHYEDATLFRDRLLDLADRKTHAIQDVFPETPNNPFTVFFKMHSPREDGLFTARDVYSLMDMLDFSEVLVTNLTCYRIG